MDPPADRTAPLGARNPHRDSPSHSTPISLLTRLGPHRGAARMSETLENLLNETRQFPPPAELAAAANVGADAYAAAQADRLAFWEAQARRLSWAKEWDQVLDWSNPPFAKWFVGGQLNIAYNCLDRHIEAGRGSKVAIYWEGEPGDTRTITYADLHRL